MNAFAPAPLRPRLLNLQLPAVLLRVLPLLTLVLLLVNTANWGLAFAPLAAWFALGAALPKLLRSALFWYVTATILGTAVYFNWESADNHRYLFVYWALAMCGAFSLPRKEQSPALALSSRWLIGLCLGLAVAWKLASPDYLSGSFFHYELLADERFAHFANWAGGLSWEQLAENRGLREALLSGHLKGTALSEVQLHSTPRIATVSQLLTWWTLGIEACVAALFVAAAVFGNRWRLALAANVALLLFAATTYTVAPVRGFGGVLMLMGLAQCEPDWKWSRYAFLAAFVLTQLCTLPLMDLLGLLR
jgi:hypothetical protein